MIASIDRRVVGFRSILIAQGQVINALLLRAVRSRFFGNGLGQLVAIGWPLTHILILLVMFSAGGRTAPVGDSNLLFIVTGVAPFIVFNYLSRFMMYGMIWDQPLLAFPRVKVWDILIARAVLEIINAFTVIILLCLILASIGVELVPLDIAQSLYALGASILLGIGMGIINSIIALAFRPWLTGYSLVVIVFYGASSILFVPDAVPEPYRTYLSYFPVLQAVAWMRSAYYEGYGSAVLDKDYLLEWGVCTIFGGLALERLLRGKLLRTG